MTTEFSRRDMLAGTTAIGALAMLPAGARAQSGDAAANALLDTIAENLLRLNPESATSLGIDKGARAALHSQLMDRSQAGQQRIADQARADLARLDSIDAAALSHGTRTSIDVVRSAFRLALDGFAQPYGDVAVGGWRNTPYVVIQNVGAYLDTPRFLDSEHQIAGAGDAEAYIARLESYPNQLDGELARLKAAGANGLIAPSFLIDKALGQLRLAAKGAREGGGLVASIERRTGSIPGDWAARARRIAVERVAPALDRQIAELTAQRARATADAGMWARPEGDAFYAWSLRAATTTRMTPEEVHQMGLDELRTLQGEMDGILRGLGYSKGSVGERMTALGKDPRFLFPEGDPGRAEIMAFIQQHLATIRARMPQAFNTLVRGNVEVKRLPPEEEPGAPGAYGGPGSIDGTVPGKFWINLHTTGLHNRYSLPTLTHHEAIPGHVWQGEYAYKLPLIRSILAFNAYSEGWALYAEQLAAELGVYADDPVGRLGYLQSIAFRACRLVVDTGLHAKRWTREQAVKWFSETNGSSIDEVSSEVDRYCSWPGQACGYKVGHSEINRQRRRAEAALGKAYDFKAFNDTVVLGGNVPLDVLATNVDAYIKDKRS
ncbi:DUF885 domain-containing protein [Sphingomonas colocasiae]|uniref:DUF885 domain-containing protein n=1 Tax=Sphingomonas colocasiae TaxID=1848973 RepID=A0ABS7PK07_9SPHN|nr:DUF885 domain-containing protein [Sphingomonas colocasiae]MBY8821314.1 DUF885 domain-containing protein [Sphingomonas colocasiae]